jgi:hypothetical protein
MEQLNVLCQGCRSGTYFWYGEPAFEHACGSDAGGSAGSIETIDEVHLDMNWGQQVSISNEQQERELTLVWFESVCVIDRPPTSSLKQDWLNFII